MMREMPFLACAFVAGLVLPSLGEGGLVRTWGGANDDYVASVALDHSGNIYAGGIFHGTVDFNPAGPNHTNLTADTSFPGGDAFLCKYAADGTFQWVRAWGAAGHDRVTCIEINAQTNVFVAGAFNNTVDFNPIGPMHSTLTASGQDAFLCMYDSDGNFQWAKRWGGSYGDEAYNLAVDGSGHAYVVGDSCSPVIDFDPAGGHSWYTNYEYPSPTYFDAWLVKYDKDGNFLWHRAWGGNGYDDCCCVTVDAMSNLFVAGMFGSTNNTCDFNADTNAPHVAAIRNAHGPALMVLDSFLCKYDLDGNFKWASTWGSTNNDPAQGVIGDGLGNVYVTGYFSHKTGHDGEQRDTVDFNPLGAPSNATSHGGGDIYLCKVATNGQLLWVNCIGGTNDDQPGKLLVDRWGDVYLLGMFKSTVDFDPGEGGSELTSHGFSDFSLSKFDSGGNLLLVRAAGGPTNDFISGAAVDASGCVSIGGGFGNTVDFGPFCGGPCTNSAGGSDAFLCRIPTCYQLTVVKSGNGMSSLGPSSPATQIVSLGVTTQVVYSSADWHRILSLASNTVAVAEAAGLKSYTQTIVNATDDITNNVTFAQATPEQTGYTNVPTVWLTNWVESAIISDAVFDVHAKYLIGLDPTTSNTFALTIESLGVSGSNAVTVLKRTQTGGLSPDGMHGQLLLQATDDLRFEFTDMPGTGVGGKDAFGADSRRWYTNVLNGTSLFMRAVIR